MEEIGRWWLGSREMCRYATNVLIGQTHRSAPTQMYVNVLIGQAHRSAPTQMYVNVLIWQTHRSAPTKNMCICRGGPMCPPNIKRKM